MTTGLIGWELQGSSSIINILPCTYEIILLIAQLHNKHSNTKKTNEDIPVAVLFVFILESSWSYMITTKHLRAILQYLISLITELCCLSRILTTNALFLASFVRCPSIGRQSVAYLIILLLAHYRTTHCMQARNMWSGHFVDSPVRLPFSSTADIVSKQLKYYHFLALSGSHAILVYLHQTSWRKTRSLIASG